MKKNITFDILGAVTCRVMTAQRQSMMWRRLPDRDNKDREIRMVPRTGLADSEENLSALRAAENWEALTEAAHQLLQQQNVDGFMHTMHTADSAGRRAVHLSGTLPAALHPAFRDQDCDGLDPIRRHVSSKGVPLTWEIDQVCGATPAVSYREWKAFGIQSGWSVGARSEHSFSRVDIYSRTPRQFARTHSHSELLLFSCYLHDAARALWLHQHPAIKAPVLTEREQQCLRWSAGGKTSKEVGMILGISQNTVYFHLKKAASKFEVYGTRHAISRALELGLI